MKRSAGDWENEQDQFLWKHSLNYAIQEHDSEKIKGLLREAILFGYDIPNDELVQQILKELTS